MMDASARSAKVVMLGMPETGKSTYMTALFIALEAQRVKTRMKLASYAGDRTYVNRLAEQLRDLKSLDHTQFGTEGEMTLDLEDDSGRIFSLTIPDHSGETLDRALTRRAISDHVAEAIGECQGLVLFLHPDTINPGSTVADADKIIAALGATSTQPAREKPRDWSNNLARTDVQMVDALQEVSANATPALRVSIVISAWDIARLSAPNPYRWLQQEMPLLTQYLANNADHLTSRVFGVSAQGGNYETDREELLAKEASSRTIVIGDCCEPHDLSAVIAWLLDDEPNDAD
jgi:hypothetical protein